MYMCSKMSVLYSNLYDNKKLKNDYNMENIHTFLDCNYLSNNIQRIILDNCIDNNILPYCARWWADGHKAFDFNISYFVLDGSSDNIHDIKIIFGRNWAYNIKEKYTCCNIIESNNSIISSGCIYIYDNYFTHNGIKYYVSDKSKIMIKILYPKMDIFYKK